MKITKNKVKKTIKKIIKINNKMRIKINKIIKLKTKV